MSTQQLLVEQLSTTQPVQASGQVPKRPTLREGLFQSYEGHIQRRTKILKRWKHEYIKVIPGIARYI